MPKARAGKSHGLLAVMRSSDNPPRHEHITLASCTKVMQASLVAGTSFPVSG
jgi:hypothetical protein